MLIASAAIAGDVAGEAGQVRNPRAELPVRTGNAGRSRGLVVDCALLAGGGSSPASVAGGIAGGTCSGAVAVLGGRAGGAGIGGVLVE